VRRERSNKQSTTIGRFAVAREPKSGHLFDGIIHGNLVAGFNDSNGDIVPIRTPGIRIAGVIDEPGWRLHQDVLTIHDGQERSFFYWKSVDCLIAQDFPASINDDFARFDASRREHSASVNRRIPYDDCVHLRRES
jgi:hypothetical protein